MGGKHEVMSKEEGEEGMEQWVPLFEIFLHSPFPETEASLWFQQHAPPSTSAFLSFLLQTQTQAQAQAQPIIFLQTLPPFVQSRVLSFLAYDSPRFPRAHLRSLASCVLHSDRTPADFWLRRAASNLLDEMPQLQLEHDFYSIPKWFPNSTTTTSLLSWLPVRPEHFEPTNSSSESRDVVMNEEREQEIQEEDMQEQVESCSLSPSPLDPLAIDEATKLKVALSNSDSTSQTLRIARQVRNACLAAKAGRRLAVLELIQPWGADDETLSVLLSGLCNDEGTGKGDMDWPAHVLCSVSLPAFLTLTSPASRVLLSATIGFCKLHPVAAVEALVFPLALSGKGINVAVCDVLARVVKDCLHPAHVSAFCQRLLCGKVKGRRVVCLPCHRGLISDAVVWTESMFTLFQQILNLGVYFTPDTAHQLVLVIDEVAEKFSRSLKFGNFLLCFVTKCVRAVEFHKALLESAAKKTDTFVTKSILSKLEVH